MKKGNSIFQGYNCQAMVDNDRIIVANEIVNNCSDRDQTVPMVHVTVEMLKKVGMSEEEISSISFLMDKGYNNSSAIGVLMDENYNIYMPFYNYQLNPENAKQIRNYHCKVSKKDGACMLECPGEQSLTGTLANKNSETPVYKFVVDESHCMNCEFADKCANRTKTTKTFTICASIFDNLEKIEDLKEKMSDKEELDIYHKRLGTVEPVFGTVTYHRNFKGFLVRGIDKVKLQWNMVCSAFNLRRIWKLSTEKT